MIDTHPFSHNIIYDQLKDFFIANGVEKKKFKTESPNLIYQETITKDGKDFCVFGIDYRHRLWQKFSSHLNANFHFTSELGKLIKRYNELFNQSGEACYKIYHHHFVNISGQIEKLYIFDFEQMNYGGNCTFIVETKDTDVNLFEQEILEYYINSFTKEFPVELIKPISAMTEDERNLVRMICI